MSEQSTALATRSATDMMSSPASFEHLCRVAGMFAQSPLVPDHLRKGDLKQATANCMICLAMAQEMGENPIVVMQNIHFVNGKFGWSASYMIARANRCGVFKQPIDWRISGHGQDLSVTAYAFLSVTGVEVSMTCSMAMAKAEGWTKNPKYSTMPEVMLRYRSAAFLVRMYAPEVMLGYHTADEIRDMDAATPEHRPQVKVELPPEAPEPTEQPIDTTARVEPSLPPEEG